MGIPPFSNPPGLKTGAPVPQTPITAAGATTITGSGLNRSYIVDPTAGNISLTVDVTKGNRFEFKRTDASPNSVTIFPSAGLIDGIYTSVPLTTPRNLVFSGEGASIGLVLR